MEHSKVRDAGFEYITALREAGDDHAEETAVFVDEKTAGCVRKFDETDQIVLMNFWSRFAEGSITTLAHEAKSAIDEAEKTDYKQKTRKQRDLMNKSLE